jgi:hypothetical protein
MMQQKLANVRIAARLNATAPHWPDRLTSFGPPDRGGFALALLCFTWRRTVFGSDEWESNVIGYGHGGLLSSLHIVSAYFSPYSFGRRAFLTLPRAKPDDTAAERRSISASENALAINVILKAAMAYPPANCESFLHLIFDRIGRGRGLSVQPVTV